MAVRSPGLALSLKVKRQRALLDAIGERLGTPVVYLKAAWADPVLYGGRGERWGSDLDILVEERVRMAFAQALEREGFRPDVNLAHHMQRGWQLRPPPEWVCVDLHRGIGEMPWFPIDTASLLKRSHAWESVDGPILGLCAEDQVVHATAHYAADRYTLDERHLGDIERLLEQHDVDWDAVMRTCAKAHMTIALHVFVSMLRRRGAVVPDVPLTVNERLRLSALHHAFGVGTARRFFTNNRTANIRIDLLFFFPLLSTRMTALPRLLVSSAAARLERRSDWPWMAPSKRV